jgi:hypothetical protein
MTILITVLGIIAGIVILVLLAALFVKKEYAVQSQITIDKNSRIVFDYIKYLKNQAYYSKWVMMDPNAKMDYSGTDGTVGFTSSWDSENKNVGAGVQEIKKIVDGERIDCEIRFERPFKNVAQTYMEVTPISETNTTIEWGMLGKNPYPFNLMNLFIPGMLAKDLDTSLSTLKNNLEK